MNNTRRKRGAQDGNWNAFKHGFYSKRFRPLEIQDLDTALGDGLEDEIALLRVIIRRVFEYADDDDKQTLDQWSKTLNTLGAASTRLAALIRTQQVVSGGGSSVLDLLSEAIGGISHELGLGEPITN
jgi:predicted NBD/HSP70 family sugar kinase